IYYLIYHGIMELKYGIFPIDANGMEFSNFWKCLKLIGIMLSCAFVLAFILQGLLAVALEHTRIKAPVRKMLPAVFLFPAFMIIYAIAITLGVFSKPKWKQIKRNASTVNIGGTGQPAAESAATDGGGAEGEIDDSVGQSAVATGGDGSQIE
ncbi:MAG: hypothetical protein K2L54_05470, partial [Clostridiales bacterium]|nr:hypothetical protein [Clostridiales bacterium]